MQRGATAGSSSVDYQYVSLGFLAVVTAIVQFSDYNYCILVRYQVPGRPVLLSSGPRHVTNTPISPNKGLGPDPVYTGITNILAVPLYRLREQPGLPGF